MVDLVPIVLFLVIGLVICTFFYFRHRSRQELQLTLRAAIERGQELSPQVLEALSGDLGGPERDLRKGALWLAMAIALGLMSWAMSEPDLLGPAAFPLMLGIAYVGLWLFNPRKNTDGTRAAE